MIVVLVLAGGVVAVLTGYFGAWWVIGHEPLLKRHCHCRER